jgi:hypothetical protein
MVNQNRATTDLLAITDYHLVFSVQLSNEISFT